MASKIQVEFLHCDQGMGSLIRIYNAKGELKNLVLFDLGTDTMAKAKVAAKGYSARAVSDVMDALLDMEAPGVDPCIALLTISHQDEDHWSLLSDLADRMDLNFDKETTKVKEIRYGGRDWSDKSWNSLIAFQKRVHAPEPLPFGDNESGYSNYATLVPGSVAKIDGVNIRVLAVNVDCFKGPAAIKNGTSAVMVVEFNGTNCIFPGDATSETMAFINDEIFKRWLKVMEQIPTNNCKALSAPHHGSVRTFADNFTSKNPKLSIAKQFTEYVQPQKVIASAGYYTRHHHPSKLVMKELGAYATKADAHGYVAYDHELAGDKDEKWQQIWTKKGIYTTLWTVNPPKGEPPNPTAWTFTIDHKGIITFELKEPRQARRASQRDRYPAVPASLREN